MDSPIALRLAVLVSAMTLVPAQSRATELADKVARCQAKSTQSCQANWNFESNKCMECAGTNPTPVKGGGSGTSIYVKPETIVMDTSGTPGSSHVDKPSERSGGQRVDVGQKEGITLEQRKADDRRRLDLSDKKALDSSQSYKEMLGVKPLQKPGS